MRASIYLSIIIQVALTYDDPTQVRKVVIECFLNPCFDQITEKQSKNFEGYKKYIKAYFYREWHADANSRRILHFLKR